jgi:hypothetical protein
MSKTTTRSASPAAQPKSKFEAFVTALLAGCESDLPATLKSLVLDGETLTLTVLEQDLQAAVDAFANVRSAKAAAAKAVADSKAPEARARQLAKAMVAFLKQQFGSTNAAMLAKFGVTITAPKATSTTGKVLGIAKRRAKSEAKKAAAQAAAAASATAIVVGASGVQLATPPATTPAAK